MMLITSHGFCLSKLSYQTEDSIKAETNGRIIISDFTHNLYEINDGVKVKVNFKVLKSINSLILDYKKDSCSILLPLWSNLNTESKEALITSIGSETDAKKLFESIYNNFKITSLLFIIVEKTRKSNYSDNYINQYKSDLVSFMWWKKQRRDSELKWIYKSAKIILQNLPKPIPVESSIIDYFGNVNNFSKINSNFLMNLYLFLNTYIKIYELKKITPFNEYMYNYFKD